MKCIICDKEYFHFNSHITKQHSLTLEDHYNLENPNISKSCSRSGCNNAVNFSIVNYHYNLYCTKSCASKDLGPENIRKVIEWLLWSNSEFQKLKPCKQDLRFYHGRDGGFKLDFSFPDHQICLELDDPTIHDKAYDKFRDAWLRKNGWKTLRITNQEIKENIDSALLKINNFIKENSILISL